MPCSSSASNRSWRRRSHSRHQSPPPVIDAFAGPIRFRPDRMTKETMNLSLASPTRDSNRRSWRVQAGALLIIVSLLLGAFPAGCIHADADAHELGSGLPGMHQGPETARVGTVSSTNSHDCGPLRLHALMNPESARGVGLSRELANEPASSLTHAYCMANVGSGPSGQVRPPSLAPDQRRALLQVYRL